MRASMDYSAFLEIPTTKGWAQTPSPCEKKIDSKRQTVVSLGLIPS